MNPPSLPKPALASSQGRALRRLYLTLFLRGRSSRGVDLQKTPKSVFSKLALSLVIYALVGLTALSLRSAELFQLSFYLHAMGLLFLGMFIASSAGEVLFNKEEGEILMHRPISSAVLLRSKLAVLVQISLYLTWAFNLVGTVLGTAGPHGNWTFSLAHLLSTGMVALFCAGGVVLIYQLCLRWFGRGRLENIMTAGQVLLTVAFVGAGQVSPYLMEVVGKTRNLASDAWWMFLLPPAWFAGFDEVVAGHASASSWWLAGTGLAATFSVVAFALGKLAGDYQTGMQTLAESQPQPLRSGRRPRLLDRLMDVPPLSWCLRDPLTRCGFRLTAAYLSRDRDMKLRLYPGLAPILMMPAIFFLQGIGDRHSNFEISVVGAFLGVIPLFSLHLLQFSQHWQASDVFRAAPLAGPAPMIRGATHATVFLLTIPVLIVLTAAVWFLPDGFSRSLMFLPGLIMLPAFALVPGAFGHTVPLSRPTEEAVSVGRGLVLMLPIFFALALGGIAAAARHHHFFAEFLLVEVFLSGFVSVALWRKTAGVRWSPLE